MKKKLKNITLLIGLFSMLFLNACKEKIDPIVDELDFNRAFAPIGIKATVENKTTVTLTWTAGKNVDQYVLEIYEGADFTPASLVETAEIESDITTYTTILTGDTEYSVRLKIVSSLEGLPESKWSIYEFETLPENLFDGFVSEMTGLHTCIVRWKPGENVTGLIFDDGITETPYTLTAGEIAAGEKTLSEVPNAKYEIRLIYSTAVRGKVNLVIEGDALLEAGGNLNTALDALPAGGVLILANGTTFALTEPDTVDVSIKIRGLFAENLPTIYLVASGGNHLFDIGTTMTAADSLVFENLDITCAYDNGATRHRGIIDQENTPLHIGLVKFNNCMLRNSDRSAIRLRGNAEGQVITNLEFNKCIMLNFATGGTQSYGIINPNAATATIANIKFTNSSIYSFKNMLINYGSGIGCQSILIDNCTFDQMMLDASNARYFIDFGTAGTSTGTITISDCIFGSTGALANGIRLGQMTIAGITGSYYTSDFKPVNDSFTSSMTAYSGASTNLWVDVLSGNFNYADQTFAGIGSAGDPRWE